MPRVVPARRETQLAAHQAHRIHGLVSAPPRQTRPFLLQGYHAQASPSEARTIPSTRPSSDHPCEDPRPGPSAPPSAVSPSPKARTPGPVRPRYGPREPVPLSPPCARARTAAASRHRTRPRCIQRSKVSTKSQYLHSSTTREYTPGAIPSRPRLSAWNSRLTSSAPPWKPLSSKSSSTARLKGLASPRTASATTNNSSCTLLRRFPIATRSIPHSDPSTPNTYTIINDGAEKPLSTGCERPSGFAAVEGGISARDTTKDKTPPQPMLSESPLSLARTVEARYHLSL